MTRYHAHPSGYLTIDNDPTPVLITCAYPDSGNPNGKGLREAVILSELASDGNHAREWAARAEVIVAALKLQRTSIIDTLLYEMAEYHRGQEGKG